jgi:hypothetical protein
MRFIWGFFIALIVLLAVRTDDTIGRCRSAFQAFDAQSFFSQRKLVGARSRWRKRRTHVASFQQLFIRTIRGTVRCHCLREGGRRGKRKT